MAEISVRTGCDLQSVADVASALERFGARYLDRIHTETEQRRYRGRSPDGLAARFAAKEAVLKLLGRPDIDPLTIEILSDDAGRPGVLLHGRAADLARRAGLGPVDVSLSHDHGRALAVATAIRTEPSTTSTGTTSTGTTTPASDHAAPTPATGDPVTSTAQIESEVRQVLADHGRLGSDARALSADADLYAAGLTSHASVTVMLGLEDAFDVEFPQHLLKKSTFASIAAISGALDEIGVQTPEQS